MAELSFISLLPTLPPLPRGRITEVMGTASTAFAALAAGKTSGPILWIVPLHAEDHPYAPGLAEFFDPARLSYVWVTRPQEALWASEEALRSGACGTVITELSAPPGFTEGRRLQLAAQEGGSLGLLMIPPHHQTTPSTMRWLCDSQVSASFDSTRWRWQLKKNKTGTFGTEITTGPGAGWSEEGWDIVWERKTRRLNLASALGDQPCRAPGG